MMRRVLALLCCFACAWAQTIVHIEPRLQQEHLELSADLDLPLNRTLRESAERGVALYFTAEVDIREPRWWWFERSVLTRSRTWRVTHNALTRQWLVRIDEVAWPVASLDEAMRLVTQIRGWRVAQAHAFRPGNHYRGRLRLRLDTSHLARPFQVHALNSSAWSLQTPWAEFAFTVAEPTDAPADSALPDTPPPDTAPATRPTAARAAANTATEPDATP